MAAADTMTNALTVRGLRLTRGSREILKGVDMQAREGDVVSMIGASGSGRRSTASCSAIFLFNPTMSIRSRFIRTASRWFPAISRGSSSTGIWRTDRRHVSST